MPKLGRKSKLGIVLLIALVLLILGALFFPVPEPEVHLSANYGGDAPAPFFTLGPIYFTNTLISSLMTVVVLALIFFFATRKMKLVPTGLQNIAELAVEIFLGFVEGVAGKVNGRRFFPIVATIFFFVLVNAWLGLLPIFNVIGWGHSGTSETLLSSMVPSVFPSYSGHVVATALLRPANTDVNVPMMLALVSFVAVEYWGITALGGRHYFAKFLRFAQLRQGLGQLIRGRVRPAVTAIVYGAIDVFVGSLELLSEFVRIISFTFRLFGNMTAGEVLLLMIAFIIPWLVPVIFYGLETLLGFIQALIFSGLTLVFATLAVAPHTAEHD